MTQDIRSRIRSLVSDHEEAIRDGLHATTIFGELTAHRDGFVYAETKEALGWLAGEIRASMLAAGRLYDAVSDLVDEPERGES